ncbi:HEXXH motif domain-containing protein [Paractinoplanes durhamensis]|uniref:HEXXH motif domain-containing protein n=1 Tax=Paractinoplanes durhamensis TaxID=113563 RepID=UPI001943C0E9|nr:HEXXH motif domain-containing protein [Actinoplanes durhamensis]
MIDAARPGRIRLGAETFDRLAAGGGDPAVIAELQAGQYSRRMVLLRAFLEAAGPGPAWSALERAERAAPGEVSAILMHPQVGSWLAYTLRRPADAGFGQLHAVAIVASAAAGLPYRAEVPLRDGRVMLPRLGMAMFDGCAPSAVAEIATEDGRIWLRHAGVRIDVPPPGVDGPGWWALRAVTVGDDVRLTVWLDDLDPMRDLADPVPPARLSDPAVARWTGLLAGAWDILVERHRPLAEALAAGVSSLVPLPVGEGWGTRSASSGDAFGAIMCSLPPDPVTLAVSLAHEFMHIKLGGLMHLVVLTEGSGRPGLYAPWRDDPRPAGGLLQGIYAFFGIAAFWRMQRHTADLPGKLADFEYAYARAQTREALGVARRDGGLTEAGRRFTDRLAAEMDTWQADRLDPEAVALAALVADGHRAGWRIRHGHPAAVDVAALAAAWQAGSAEPVAVAPSEVWPDETMRHWSSARLGLARRRLTAPDRYAAVRGESWGSGLSDADLALFAGDPVAARKGFAEQVHDDPASADAWTGLGLAMARAGMPGGAVLLARPEVVAALHAGLGGRPDPAGLAAWTESAIPHQF